MSSFVKDLFGNKIYDLYKRSIDDVKFVFEDLDYLKLYNQHKVLQAFKEHKISDSHFVSTTGYAYTDLGREGIENLYKEIFKTESALVRLQFVNGTHAIGCAILGNLTKGEILFSITGKPYDTIQNIIGLDDHEEYKGSLKDLGVKYLECDLKNDKFDVDKIVETIINNPKIKMIYIQRSRGYSLRKSILVDEIKHIVKIIKSTNKDINIFVDNCYGELVETKEPGHVGADIVVGSLMKNLGGGIAPTGGYIAGNQDLVYMVAERLTAPGIGKDLGANFNLNNAFFKGIFMAPNAVKNALKTAIFTAYMLEKLEYSNVSPRYDEPRTDIIQTLELKSKENLVNFTQVFNKAVRLIHLSMFYQLQCQDILLMRLWLRVALLKAVQSN